MTDWLRHKLGLRCRQAVTDHGFVACTWTTPWPSPEHCGWRAHSQAVTCWLRERCHA
jgi:hypothetical protein